MWALARSVARRALSAFRRPGIGPHGRHGPAPITAPKSRPAGASGAPAKAMDLRARAERQCNRNRRLVARYLKTHDLLMNGRDR
jgi:hypothetical protein